MKPPKNNTGRFTLEDERGFPIPSTERENKENTENWGFLLKDKKKSSLNKSKGDLFILRLLLKFVTRIPKTRNKNRRLCPPTRKTIHFPVKESVSPQEPQKRFI